MGCLCKAAKYLCKAGSCGCMSCECLISNWVGPLQVARQLEMMPFARRLHEEIAVPS